LQERCEARIRSARTSARPCFTYTEEEALAKMQREGFSVRRNLRCCAFSRVPKFRVGLELEGMAGHAGTDREIGPRLNLEKKILFFLCALCAFARVS